MLFSCKRGSDQAGVFFTELLKKFSQEKYEEGWKQEYLVREEMKIPGNIILTR